MSDPTEPDAHEAAPSTDRAPKVTVSVPPPPTPPKATEQPASARKIPRTWPQRLTIVAVFAMAIGSFGAAGALYAGQRVIEDRNIAPAIIDPSQTTTIVGAQPDAGADAETVESVAPPETFPPVEPDAKNFLITGADNNSCIDPDSPYAPAFGDRTNLGERSDTIMMWRVNPARRRSPCCRSRATSSSTSPDVTSGAHQRGVRARQPPAADRHDLPELRGQHRPLRPGRLLRVPDARQRGRWRGGAVRDAGARPEHRPQRDRGRLFHLRRRPCARLRPLAQAAVARPRHRRMAPGRHLGPRPHLAPAGLPASHRVGTAGEGGLQPRRRGWPDRDPVGVHRRRPRSHPRKMLEFAGVLSGVDPAAITTYQITADPRTIQGNAVLVPTLGSDNMQAILAVFRGEALLGDAPVQVIEPGVAPRRDRTSHRAAIRTPIRARRRRSIREPPAPSSSRHRRPRSRACRPTRTVSASSPTRTSPADRERRAGPGGLGQASRTRARAAAASDGPLTVVKRAPTCSASARASASSDSGATMTLAQPTSSRRHVTGRRRPGSPTARRRSCGRPATGELIGHGG